MEDDNNIDYFKLTNAISFYKERGFEYKDVDWVVSKEISNITKPSNLKNYYVEEKVLVGSAEQTFIEMSLEDKLPKGRYVGLTPCFRDDVVDKLHNKYFMKVELIDTLNPTYQSLNEIIDTCVEFYKKYIPCTVIKTGHLMYDIVDLKNNIELGSYGLRKYGKISWVYATGCAEPRLTKCINL